MFGEDVFGEPPGQILWNPPPLPVEVWAFSSAPSFTGHLLPFTCGKQGPFPDNRPLFTPSWWHSGYLAAEGGVLGGILKTGVVSQESY